jgi:plasmid stabilization system protein ParE
MLEISWTTPAKISLNSIETYITKHNPIAASHVIQHIHSLTTHLRTNPHMGISGRKPKTRELKSPKYPYFVIYRVNVKSIEILNIIHNKRLYPANKLKH